MGQNERRERLIESYLRGLTEHLGDLEECLRELGREREELEWEGRALDLGLKANEEEREWVLGYIEEIPRLCDRTLRSLVRHAEELGSEPQGMSKPIYILTYLHLQPSHHRITSYILCAT